MCSLRWALAGQLRELGCLVHLCVPPNFTARVTELGFEARPIGIEMRPPRPGAPPMAIPDLIADQFNVLEGAALDCDVIVGAGLHQYAARSVAEHRGLGYVIAAYAPVSLPSADLPPPGPYRDTHDPVKTRRLWADTRRGWNERSLTRVNANRAKLGLPPVDDLLGHILGTRALLACDKLLGPAPTAPELDVVQTGAWILPDRSPLPADLEEFLAVGEPPVYLGFGSMPAPADASRPLVEAARSLGRRMVLSEGWAGLAKIDDQPDCIMVGDVNHQALFPRVAAVVHHGGAGTTTSAALAGAPQVIAPLFSDQFYWAERVAELGNGATSSAQEGRLLAQALETALRSDVAVRASSVAQQVSTRGAELAARIVIEEGGS